MQVPGSNSKTKSCLGLYSITILIQFGRILEMQLEMQNPLYMSYFRKSYLNSLVKMIPSMAVISLVEARQVLFCQKVLRVGAVAGATYL